MMKKHKTKKVGSVARTLTRRVTLFLLVALTVMFICSYILVMNIVIDKTQSHSKATISMYTDLCLEFSKADNVPLDTAHADIPIRYGDYICLWYHMDYAYLLVPDVENGTVTYIACTQEPHMTNRMEDNWVGRTVDYVLSDEEAAVWNGEKLFGFLTQKNQYGYEYSTFMLIEDSFGNKIIAGVDASYHDVLWQSIGFFSLLAVSILLVVIAVYLAMFVLIRKRVSEPAMRISSAMRTYLSDGKKEKVKLAVTGNDEFTQIAASFNTMTDNIEQYLRDIHDLTATQAHQQTELEIAARIQQGILPKKDLNTAGYDLTACMLPAKDVGGDLYDYLPLDDHRILMVIADVSGKGISAAMFMAVTLVMIHQLAQMELSPDEILRRTNDALSSGNAEMLFVTAFVGIYDKQTHQLEYSNAGHNPPYLISGSSCSTLTGARGTLLGLFPDEAYTLDRVRMREGDTLLLYTDGVTEAVNNAGEFYGEARLEEALKNFRTDHAENLTAYICAAVKAFAGGAEQFDDITMLALSAKDTDSGSLELSIQDFARLKEAILALPIPRKQQLELCLAAEEHFVNICSYAFPDGVPENEKVSVTLTYSDRVIIRFEDRGVPFDPTAHTEAPDDYDIDTQIGGLGNFLAFSSVDEVKYAYEDGKNIVTFIKYIKEEET